MVLGKTDALLHPALHWLQLALLTNTYRLRQGRRLRHPHTVPALAPARPTRTCFGHPQDWHVLPWLLLPLLLPQFQQPLQLLLLQTLLEPILPLLLFLLPLLPRLQQLLLLLVLIRRPAS